MADGEPDGRERPGAREAADPARPTTSEGDARAQLERLRERIRAVDHELISLVGERRALVLEIGRLKEALGLPVLDPPQEARVVRRAAEIARDLGTDEELVRDVIWRIIASARSEQEGRTDWGPPSPPRSEPSSRD